VYVPPGQIEPLETEIVGKGATLVERVTEPELQPAELVPTTVYMVVTVGLTAIVDVVPEGSQV
jgi:hypothetical protein